MSTLTATWHLEFQLDGHEEWQRTLCSNDSYKGAKDYFQYLFAGRSPKPKARYIKVTEEVFGDDEPFSSARLVIEENPEDSRVIWVKELREKFNIGLKEALDLIDQVMTDKTS